MADTTAITIASVAIAGVAGPAITAWATTHAQRRRFDHELEVRDTGELRSLLDEAVEHLNAVERLLFQLERDFRFKGVTDWPAFEQPLSDFRDANGALNRIRAQLAIRLTEESAVYTALFAAIKVSIKVAEVIRNSYEIGDILEEAGSMSKTIEAFRSRRGEFVEAAYVLAGARVEAHKGSRA